MRHGKRVLTVVPARGGSKGVELKNLRPVAGVPLVALVGRLVARMAWIDRAVVSTDHDEIAAVAEQSGLAAPFRRPAELSGDRIGDIDVLTHALGAAETHDATTYDVIVMLQPTSPLRTVEHVERTVDTLIEQGHDAVWTVSPTDLKFHPLKQLVLSDGRLGYWDTNGADVIARQQLTPVYHRNGAAYALTRRCLTEQKTLLGANCGAVVIDDAMVSIDTVEDFEKVEAALRARGD